MSLVEYHLMFTLLSPYAPHLILDERHKIRQFVKGLNWKLYNAIAGQMKHFATCAEAMDSAKTIQNRNNKESALSRKHKGNKGKPHNGGFLKGLKSTALSHLSQLVPKGTTQATRTISRKRSKVREDRTIWAQGHVTNVDMRAT